MNTRPGNITTEQAGAQLAVVRSTVGIVVRAIVVMLAADAASRLTLAGIQFPEGIPHEVIEAVLTTLIVVPLLYAMTLRPLTKLAAKQAAASAEARFEAIAHAAGDAIIIVDVNWKAHFANRAAEKMFGTQPYEWKETSLESFMTDHAKQFLKEANERFRATGEAVLSSMGTFELDLLRRDGIRFPAEIRVSELRERGRSLFVAVLRDVSARRTAEREIQERTTRLNALLANSPLAIVVLDKNRLVQMCNPAFEELFQYRSAEIAGLELDSLVAPQEQMAEALEMTKQGMHGQAVHAIAQRQRKDGSLVDVEIHGVPLLIAGQLEGAYAIYQDMTERKKLKLYEQILPVCCVCGKIRDDEGAAKGEGSWDRLDHYISKHSDAKLSHTFCPPCLAEYKKREGIA